MASEDVAERGLLARRGCGVGHREQNPPCEKVAERFKAFLAFHLITVVFCCSDAPRWPGNVKAPSPCEIKQLLARDRLESVHLAIGIGPRLHEDGIATILASKILGRGGVGRGNVAIVVNEVGLDGDIVFKFVPTAIEVLRKLRHGNSPSLELAGTLHKTSQDEL